MYTYVILLKRSMLQLSTLLTLLHAWMCVCLCELNVRTKYICLDKWKLNLSNFLPAYILSSPFLYSHYRASLQTLSVFPHIVSGPKVYFLKNCLKVYIRKAPQGYFTVGIGPFIVKSPCRDGVSYIEYRQKRKFFI